MKIKQRKELDAGLSFIEKKRLKELKEANEQSESILEKYNSLS